MHRTIGRRLRRPERHSDCLMSPAGSAADYQHGWLNPLDRRRPPWCCPPAWQHRSFPPKTSASTPRLSRRVGALGPAVELPELATAEPPRAAVLVARLPAAVQAETVLLAKPTVQALSAQRAQVLVQALSGAPAQRGLVMQVRPDRSPEACLPTYSAPARCSPPVAAHQASSDRPGSVRRLDLQSWEPEVGSPERLALVAAPARSANALRARQC